MMHSYSLLVCDRIKVSSPGAQTNRRGDTAAGESIASWYKLTGCFV